MSLQERARDHKAKRFTSILMGLTIINKGAQLDWSNTWLGCENVRQTSFLHDQTANTEKTGANQIYAWEHIQTWAVGPSALTRQDWLQKYHRKRNCCLGWVGKLEYPSTTLCVYMSLKDTTKTCKPEKTEMRKTKRKFRLRPGRTKYLKNKSLSARRARYMV